MATAPEAGEDAQLLPGPKKHDDEQTQGLEKVTDYVEEKETATGELGQVASTDDQIHSFADQYPVYVWT